MAPPPPALGRGVFVALAVAGIVVRAEAFHLPLLGAGAEAASAARALARGAIEVPGAGGLPTAWLAAPFVFAGATATSAVRAVDLLSGALLAPLALALALRFGARPASALLVGLLALLHPSLAIASGGAAAQALGLPAVALALGVLFVAAPGVRAARATATCALVAAVGAPFGFVAALPLFLHHARREARWVWRIAPGLLAACAFALLPGARSPLGAGSAVGTGVVGTLIAFGGPIVLGVPTSWRAATVSIRAAIAATFAYAFATAFAADSSTDIWAIAPLAAPVALAFGGRGLGGLGADWARRLRLATLVAAAATTLLLAVPALGRLGPAGAESAAARARWLERATELALAAAGDDGLVAFAAPRSEAERSSAADGLAEHRDARSVREASSGWTRRGDLPTFEAIAFEPERTLGLVAERGTFASVQALGDGLVLFRFEAVGEFGPYAVLRARRD